MERLRVEKNLHEKDWLMMESLLGLKVDEVVLELNSLHHH